jgi:hypothetical protein
MLSVFPNITQQAANANTPALRQTAYRAMVNAYKQLGVPPADWAPFSKEQAAQVDTRYATANPQQRLAMLDDWFHTVPPEMVGPMVTRLVEVSGKVGANIGRDSFLYATLSGHPEFNAVMRDAMAGAEAQVDSARRISTEQADDAWRRTLPPAAVALNGAAAENYKRVAADLYVNAGGKVPTLPGEKLDPVIWQDSMRRAFGGLKNNPDTGYAQFGHSWSGAASGAVTILPPTVTRQEFQGWIDRLNPTTLGTASGGSGAYNKYGKPVLVRDIQDHGAFIMKAPGKYAIQFPDGGTLLNNKGGEYILAITPKTVRGR